MPEKSLFLSFLVLLLSGTMKPASPSTPCSCSGSIICKGLWAKSWGWEPDPEAVQGGHLMSVVLGCFFLKGWGQQDFLLSGHHAWTPLPECVQGRGDTWARTLGVPGKLLASGCEWSQSRPSAVSGLMEHPCHLLGPYLWDQKWSYWPGTSYHASPASQPLHSLEWARLPG